MTCSITCNFKDSIAFSTHPMVPSPPQTNTLNVTVGSSRHHSNAFSGESSFRSITCRIAHQIKVITFSQYIISHTNKIHVTVVNFLNFNYSIITFNIYIVITLFQKLVHVLVNIEVFQCTSWHNSIFQSKYICIYSPGWDSKES